MEHCEDYTTTAMNCRSTAIAAFMTKNVISSQNSYTQAPRYAMMTTVIYWMITSRLGSRR